jgi:hypothetical protein
VQEACEQQREFVVARTDDGAIDFSQPICYRETTHLERAINSLHNTLHYQRYFATAAEDVVTRFQESDNADERARFDGLMTGVQELVDLNARLAELAEPIIQALVGAMSLEHREWPGLDVTEGVEDAT